MAQEVLEHIENPLGLLKSISSLLAPNGRAYVVMPINAPSPAHIYLFKNIEHVKSLISEAGLEIVTEEYITVHNTTIETAEAKKLPIDACLILKMKENSFSIRCIELKNEKCVIADCNSNLCKCTEKYNIQQVKSTDDVKIAKLLKRNFCFHDRVLRVGIFVESQEEALNNIEISDGVSIILSDVYTEEMYSLACKAYKTDRRFHLEQCYDQIIADDVIRAYLTEFKEKHYLI